MDSIKGLKIKIDRSIDRWLEDYKNWKCRDLDDSYIQEMMSLAESRVILKNNQESWVIV